MLFYHTAHAMKVFEINSKVHDVDLAYLKKYATWHPFAKFFDMDAGVEHYKLLAFLASQCGADDVIYDIGTHVGYSALAMSHNENVRVVTYDLVNHINTTDLTAKNRGNIEFKLADCTQSNELVEIVKSPFVFLDVDPHDGIQEPHIFTALQNAGFKGILVLDDIHLNEGMRKFWDWVPLTKYDISKYGHHSGTGVVIFDGTKYDVKIE